VAYVLTVGLFFHEETKQTTILQRQQTDEWKGYFLFGSATRCASPPPRPSHFFRLFFYCTIFYSYFGFHCTGWMQLVILIYHMTGGSKNLPIYMLVRWGRPTETCKLHL
jgi:hypothetical protein